jgi:hypothetical protein
MLKYFIDDRNLLTSLQDEGQATLTTPPNIPSFNIVNKAHFLHPTRKVQPPPAPTPSVDVNSLTSVLLLQMLTNSGLLQSTGSPAAKAPPQAALVPSAAPPVTPLHKSPPSPPLPSPIQLKCFLLYAETNLKVRNASQYEDELDL